MLRTPLWENEKNQYNVNRYCSGLKCFVIVPFIVAFRKSLPPVAPDMSDEGGAEGSAAVAAFLVFVGAEVSRRRGGDPNEERTVAVGGVRVEIVVDAAAATPWS